MQRIPARPAYRRGADGEAQEPSPMLRLARRIREEQGVEQVRAFLAAMTPFSAPNELKRIGEGFGIPYESIERERERQKEKPVQRMNADKPGPNGSADQLGKLKMLMQLAGMMKNGGDPMALMSLLGGK